MLSTNIRVFNCGITHFEFRGSFRRVPPGRLEGGKRFPRHELPSGAAGLRHGVLLIPSEGPRVPKVLLPSRWDLGETNQEFPFPPPPAPSPAGQDLPRILNPCPETLLRLGRGAGAGAGRLLHRERPPLAPRPPHTAPARDGNRSRLANLHPHPRSRRHRAQVSDSDAPGQREKCWGPRGAGGELPAGRRDRGEPRLRGPWSLLHPPVRLHHKTQIQTNWLRLARQQLQSAEPQVHAPLTARPCRVAKP